MAEKKIFHLETVCVHCHETVPFDVSEDYPDNKIEVVCDKCHKLSELYLLKRNGIIKVGSLSRAKPSKEEEFHKILASYEESNPYRIYYDKV